MAELILTLKQRELRRVPITSTTTTIGRDMGADLSIDNVGVSRIHAQIRYSGGEFTISDAGSQNGITLNGERIKTAALNYGDVIGINKFLVQFSAAGGVPLEQLNNRARVGPRMPRDVLRTMSLDPEAAAAIAAAALRDIEKQRRDKAGDSSAGPPPPLDGVPKTEAPSYSEPPARSSNRWFVFVGGVLVGALLLAVVVVTIF